MIHYRIYTISILIISLAGILFSEQQQALIEVQSAVDTTEITIGDRINYSITIDSREGLRVENPGAGINLGQFEIKDYKISEPRTENGRTIQKFEYQISVFDTGHFEIPAFPVAYFPEDTSQNYQLIEASAIGIYVRSILNAEDKELRDVKAPIDIPFNYVLLYSLIAAGLLLLAAGYFGYRFYKKRKEEGYLFIPPKPPVPAHEKALNALNELQARDLPEQGEFKLYFTELTEIIRTYLEGRFFIKALEETTTEILKELNSIDLEAASFEELRDLLELADMVKFAKYIPDLDECRSGMTSAIDFVNASKIEIIEENEIPTENNELTKSNTKTEQLEEQA